MIFNKCFLSLIALFFLSSCTMMKLRKEHPDEIGTIAESSSYLAESITKKIPSQGDNRKILEVGAGTGVFTEKIVEKMGPSDRLDVVELMPELCEILEKKFGEHERVTIYCGDILAWQPNYKYDYIVSGLPFNAFPEDLVRNITGHFERLSQSGTVLSFFEYKWLSSIRKIVMDDDELAKFNATRNGITEFVEKYQFERDSVYLNITPANVYFLRL